MFLNLFTDSFKKHLQYACHMWELGLGNGRERQGPGPGPYNLWRHLTKNEMLREGETQSGDETAQLGDLIRPGRLPAPSPPPGVWRFSWELEWGELVRQETSASSMQRAQPEGTPDWGELKVLSTAPGGERETQGRAKATQALPHRSRHRGV